jgi:hypothetical protein
MHISGMWNIGLREKDKIKVMHREKIFPKANMQRDIAAMHRNEIRHAELWRKFRKISRTEEGVSIRK